MFKSRDFAKKRLKIPKGQSVSVYRKTDNTMAKKKVHKEKQRLTKHAYEAKVRVTRIPLKAGVNSCAPEVPVDTAQLVAPVVLI